MKASTRRLSARVLVLGLVSAVSVGLLGSAIATGARTAAPTQKNVFPQAQAAPGSGKGLVIGYATSLES